VNEQVNAADSVRIPSICLMALGILGVAFGLFDLLDSVFALRIEARLVEQLLERAQRPDLIDFLRHRENATANIVVSLFTIAASSFVAYGGLQMQRLRNPILCMIAAIVALVPCVSPCCCCCIGWTIGIWALVVLNKPAVRDAFATFKVS
jgi:hypothetical protein